MGVYEEKKIEEREFLSLSLTMEWCLIIGAFNLIKLTNKFVGTDDVIGCIRYINIL